MRWCTYRSPGTGGDGVGLVVDAAVHGVRGIGRLLDLFGDDGERLAAAAEQARRDPLEVVPLTDARLRAPVPDPPAVRDFMAFEEHVVTLSRALGRPVPPAWYELPAFYFNNPAAIRGPYDDVPVAPGSQAFDYELEVAAVVGREGGDLDPETAERHVTGYVVLCDWSARDLQRQESTIGLGPAKGKDTATSLGEFLVTPDELAPFRAGNGYRLAMTAAVNGEEWSRGEWSALHWSFGQLLAYASRGTRLRPGDVIGSGTVGTGCIAELSAVHGSQTRPWLVPGDRVRLEVEQLGCIDAGVVAGAPVIPLRRGKRHAEGPRR